MIALLIAAPALAQEAAPTEPPAPPQPKEVQLLERDPEAEPHPQHVILPDPVDEEGAGDAAAKEKRQARPPVPAQGPTVPPRIARKVPRPVRGDSPAHLHGRYAVVEITEGGLTEDYRNKMERAGRALDEDCIVIRTRFDFGELPAQVGDRYRPSTVAITRIQECTVGGLGKYAEELSVVLDVTYSEGDDVVILTLPAATVVSDYVRLRRAAEGEMRSPPQWLAPATTVEHDVQRWFLQAEAARGDALPVLHLTNEQGVVWHLEPDRGDSPFDIADRAAGAVREGEP